MDSNKSVVTIANSDKVTIDQTIDWLTEKVKNGHLKPSTGRFHITALKSMAGVLADGEPRNIDSVLSNINDIANRWANMNPGTRGGTAASYKQKASKALEWHKEFLQDPVSFSFDIRTRRSRIGGDSTNKTTSRGKGQKSSSNKNEGSQTYNNDTNVETVQQPSIKDSNYRNFPLGDGRDFHFILPEDLSIKDVKRFAYHLVSYAKDFDPEKPPFGDNLARRNSDAQ